VLALALFILKGKEVRDKQRVAQLSRLEDFLKPIMKDDDEFI
jgi:hypothetical protein